MTSMEVTASSGAPVAVAEVAGPSPALLEFARKYPRDVAIVRKQIEDLALSDPETASQMFYALPRGGKTITGPSVRLAEIAQSMWANIYIQSDIITGLPDAHEFVTVEARVIDLEKNIALSERVKRRIVDKKGNRFNLDLIQQTTNAATSIAIRNALFRVIPRSLIEPVCEKAMAVAQGRGADRLEQRRTKALDHFKKMGISEERICQSLGVSAVNEIGEEQMAELKGFATAISEGSSDPSDLFPAEEESPKAKK